MKNDTIFLGTVFQDKWKILGQTMKTQDQMPQEEVCDQGLHCLTLIHQFLDTSTYSKMDLFKYQGQLFKANDIVS